MKNLPYKGFLESNNLILAVHVAGLRADNGTFLTGNVNIAAP